MASVIQEQLIEVRDTIIDLFSLDMLPPTQQDHFFERLVDLIIMKAMTVMVDNMDEREEDAFNAFLDSEPESQEAIIAYLYDAHPIFPSVLQSAATEVLDHMLAVTYPADDVERTPEDLDQALNKELTAHETSHEPEH